MKLLFVLLLTISALACDNYQWNPFYKQKPHLAALILARGGSKGIPLKNLANIGKSLLSRSLITIIESKIFDSIWVSTDHELIYQEAKSRNVNVHLRANYTATDEASSIIAVQEFLKYHKEIDIIGLIQCTSPFLKVKYLHKALMLINKHQCVFSATRSFKLRWREIPNGIEPLNFNPLKRIRRQDNKGEMEENGMFYFAPRNFIENGYFQNNRCRIVEVSNKDSLDIDSNWDLFLANLIHSSNGMTTDFSGGQVPAIYREVFDACSIRGEPIHRDVLHHLLLSCNLDKNTMKTIWELTGPSNGSITRTQLYKTLALIAWAQNGKVINESLFTNLSGREYPTPLVGNLEELKNQRDVLREKSPAELGLTYNDIKQIDNIGVELVPEKKGLILKYSEYTVSSRRFSSKVTRRYNDFVALYDLLIARFPYRLVPRLPPKKIVSDSHFLESRRRGLQRWLTLICRHPVICYDNLILFFLTDQGPDLQYRIRELYRRAPDEFMTSDLAGNAKSYLPNDYLEFATNREQVRALVQIVSRIKQLTDAEVERTNAHSRDTEDLTNQLKSLGSANADHLPGRNWKRMQKGFISIAEELKELPNKASQHAIAEQVAVCEKIALLLDVLIAHRDLCERLEKGLSHDHQAALAKMLSLKKRKIQGVIRGTDSESVEQLEAKMLTQENLITNMELRSDFSMYCVHMETQLVHTYLETLSSIITSMVSLHIRLHAEFGDIWKQVNPTMEKYFTMESGSNGNKVS